MSHVDAEMLLLNMSVFIFFVTMCLSDNMLILNLKLLFGKTHYSLKLNYRTSTFKTIINRI